MWDARTETINNKLLTNKINNSKMVLYTQNGILYATKLFEQKKFGLESFME